MKLCRNILRRCASVQRIFWAHKKPSGIHNCSIVYWHDNIFWQNEVVLFTVTPQRGIFHSIKHCAQQVFTQRTCQRESQCRSTSYAAYLTARKRPSRLIVDEGRVPRNSLPMHFACNPAIDSVHHGRSLTRFLYARAYVRILITQWSTVRGPDYRCQ